jgi:outer membrane protein
VLYAEDKYDITNEIIKLLNDKYKSSKSEVKTETKAIEKKK